jgi:hypothetical protein
MTSARQPRACKTLLVRFDYNRYSVHAKAAGRPVEIHAYADRIGIRQNGEIVADHVGARSELHAPSVARRDHQVPPSPATAPEPGRGMPLEHDDIKLNHPVTPALSRGPALRQRTRTRDPGSRPG